jgi:hypothetical protein
MAGTKSAARPLTDHDEIRRWAQERNAKPACVRHTGRGNQIGMIRLDFPGYSGEGSLQEISWNDWFQKFDENNLALLIQEQTARGSKSNFNKLVIRDTAEQSGRNGGRASRRSSSGRSRRSETSNSQSASSDDDFDVEEVKAEEAEPTTRIRSRGKHQARRRAGSGSRKGRAAAARRAGSSARGERLRRTIARGSSNKRSSARRTSSRPPSLRSRTSRSKARGSRARSRGLQIVGKKSARRAHSGSGRGRGGGRRAA